MPAIKTAFYNSVVSSPTPSLCYTTLPLIPFLLFVSLFTTLHTQANQYGAKLFWILYYHHKTVNSLMVQLNSIKKIFVLFIIPQQ